MVQDAKAVAGNIRDQGKIGKWRDSNQKLLDSVGKVRKAVAGPEPPPPPPPDMSGLQIRGGDHAPPRPPPPETDDEDEMFRRAPASNQPILVRSQSPLLLFTFCSSACS